MISDNEKKISEPIWLLIQTHSEMCGLLSYEVCPRETPSLTKYITTDVGSMLALDVKSLLRKIPHDLNLECRENRLRSNRKIPP